jgi:hypothetical protein
VANARSAAGFSVKVLFPAEGVMVALTAGPPAVGASVRLLAVRVAGLIASENVATTSVAMAMPVAAGAGWRSVSVGAVVSGAGAVVNDQVCWAAIGLPAASAAPVVTVAVYEVAKPRSDAGFSVKAVFPAEAAIVALTAGPPAVGASVKVLPVRVAGFMASEKVATTSAPIATPVAPGAGWRPVSVGGVVSGAAAVVNAQVCWVARALPAASAAPVVTVAV